MIKPFRNLYFVDIVVNVQMTALFTFIQIGQTIGDPKLPCQHSTDNCFMVKDCVSLLNIFSRNHFAQCIT